VATDHACDLDFDNRYENSSRQGRIFGVSPAARSGRIGRPPRIDRTAIAEAVLELGLDGISMKAVADHLGVSVAGLYHHVANRRELLVLAAERSLSRARTPEDRGQHWDEWLREWARHVYRSFVDEPEILSQWMTGALKWESMVDVIDSVILVLERADFDPPQAVAAFDTVARYAVGAAVHEIRRLGAMREGRSTLADLHATTAMRPGELVGVEALLATPPLPLTNEFDDGLTAVLAGIAVRRGEDPAALLVRAAHSTHSVDDTDSPPRDGSLSA
jgi:AcrR family transcriptional regulator